MAVQFTNFLNAPSDRRDYSSLGNLFENAFRGYQMSQEPAKQERQAQKENLANALAQMQLEHQPTEMSLRDQLLKQQIEKAKNSGISFSGDLGNRAKLEQLKKERGESDPFYMEMRDLFKKSLTNKFAKDEATTERMNILNQTQSDRSSTQMAKLNKELNDVNEGYLPGSNQTIRITPEQQDRLKNQYELKIIKDTSDSDTRKKINYAVNIDKTLSQINVPDLVQYAGLKGSIQRKIDQGKTLSGEESKQYEAFQKALVGAETLAKQVRQFYGDSIQPKNLERLEKLTNPSFWNNNPKIAASMFDQFATIIKSETQTYLDAVKKSSAYMGQANAERLNGLQPASGNDGHEGEYYDLKSGQWKNG